MPSVHTVPGPKSLPKVLVKKGNEEKLAEVLNKANDRFLVTYVGEDKRMDEWVHIHDTRQISPFQYILNTSQSSQAESSTSRMATPSATGPPTTSEADPDVELEELNNGRKRKRTGSLSGNDAPSQRARSSSPATRLSSVAPSDDPPQPQPNGQTQLEGGKGGGKGKAGGKARTRARVSRDDMNLAAANAAAAEAEEITMTEEEYDLEQHKKITRQRNFDDVYFGNWRIKTWYYSPYPLQEIETELEEAALSPELSNVYSKIAPTSAASRAGGRSRTRASDLFAGVMNRPVGAELPNLYVCDRCLKYFSEGITWETHQKACEKETPPGELVYKRGAHAIREIDGAKQKLYCQFLSLFGKLFIDVKTLFFDTDNFIFYVLTTWEGGKEQLVGFFSKEKHSFDDYNLACITTLPHHQKQGFGMLMIEFSYELSRRAKKVGTPERPLSDLGLRSYLAYWVATIIRFFRHVLTVLPPAAEGLSIKNVSAFPDLSKPTPGLVEDPLFLAGKKKKARSLPPVDVPVTPFDEMDDEVFTKFRIFETKLLPDGSAQTHCRVRFTLQDLARACNLRLDDAAFAMNECGLLTKRIVHRQFESAQVNGHTGGEDGQPATVSSKDTIVITRELVEKVAKERKVKKMVMDLRYICIDRPPRQE